MPAVSFKEQFCPRVRSGAKHHTIRAKRKRPWKVGDSIALYYGQRSQYCKLLGRSKVTKVESILIDFVDPPDALGERFIRIRIDGIYLDFNAATTLARSDGFKDLSAMAAFWWKTHRKKLPFRGDVIHWSYPFEKADK